METLVQVEEILPKTCTIDKSSNDEQQLVQVEETSLKPMESVEEITSAVQLENAKAKVENINSSPETTNVLLMFSG